MLAASASCAPITARTRGPSTYRAPALVLAYPASGADLPADRPVVLIRSALREADDPIDAASFRATVDGVDRTARFRATTAEAWGTLADSGAADTSRTLAAAGPHTIAARVCSARGVCGALTAVVDVRPWERALGRPRRSN